MKWNEIEDGLRELSVAEQMPDTATFQAEAKAKARNISQDSRESAGTPSLIPSWVFAAACALIVGGIVMFQFRPQAPDPQPGALLAQNTEITSLHVPVEHSAVIITNDSDSQATIVWIAGLEPQSGG
jgi:hypothetical protein